jgi:hypothetical protein
LISGLVAAVLALSIVAPGFAQSTSGGGGVVSSGSWTGSSDAQGANTYIGHVEAPRAGQNVAAGSNLLVSGWAADTTAEGWAGFDQMQVYNGDKAKGGTKVADGQVGLSRPDVASFIGPNFRNSGFSAVVPSGALSGGQATLFVYLHTASKGWWFQSVGVNQQAPVALDFPNDPVVVIGKPVDGSIITTKQVLNRYVLVGYALDQNPVTDPGNQSKLFGPVAGPGEAGIQSVVLYLDKTPNMAGYDPAVNFLANAGLGIEDLASAQGPAAGPVHTAANKSTITRAYGPQYEFAGWVASWDTRNAQPDMEHTIYAVATSSITKKTSTASTTFYLKSTPSNHPACSNADIIAHRPCNAILNG